MVEWVRVILCLNLDSSDYRTRVDSIIQEVSYYFCKFK